MRIANISETIDCVMLCRWEIFWFDRSLRHPTTNVGRRVVV